LIACPMAEESSASAPGRVAVLILAGGQGSRLGFSGPKGCFSLLGKSLFERHAEKIRSRQTPVAIMTSELNHAATVSFFAQHNYFGLQGVLFFSQSTLPFFDEQGHWFLGSPAQIAEGPDGNGSVFAACEKAGILENFQERGVQTVHVIPVDNPLADPLDPVLHSFHVSRSADLTVKCLRLSDPYENAGRLTMKNGRLSIAEFAELDDARRQISLIANSGLLAIDLALMRKLSSQPFPFHWAWRATPQWKQGQLLQKQCWKAERFIVDALLYAEQAQALCYPRKKIFAPLKDLNSVTIIEQALIHQESVK
jgi:UDP-N-acetylglucosamine pyrophosphorylase